jgi:hypothetical protein
MVQVQKFLDRLYEAEPRWDDGFCHSITIEGGVAAHDDTTHAPLFSYRIEFNQEGDL